MLQQYTGPLEGGYPTCLSVWVPLKDFNNVPCPLYPEPVC